MPAEGEIRVNRLDPNRKAVFQGGVWVEQTGGGAGASGAGSTPRPEYGNGAYETSDGSVLRPTKGGSVQIMRGAQTAGAEARTRLQLGLGPSVAAQKNLFEEEQWNQSAEHPGGSNPNDSIRGMVSNMLAPENPNDTLRVMASKSAGGDRLARYKQASASFETAFLPILSGAAVTPSEASRMVKASLPAPGDTPEILARKATNRAMMINGAAKLLGQPLPFPKVGAMDFGQGGSPKSVTPAKPKAPAKVGGFEVLEVLED